MLYEFTDANFESEVLKSEVPVLVDFWAPWCGPCRITGPMVEALAKEMEGKSVKIGKMNVDENSKTAGEYGIMSIPTFMVFKDGKLAGQAVGTVSKEKLRSLIAG